MDMFTLNHIKYALNTALDVMPESVERAKVEYALKLAELIRLPTGVTLHQKEVPFEAVYGNINSIAREIELNGCD